MSNNLSNVYSSFCNSIVRYSILPQNKHHRQECVDAAVYAGLAQIILRTPKVPQLICFPVATLSLAMIIKPVCRQVYTLWHKFRGKQTLALPFFQGGLALLTFANLKAKITSHKTPAKPFWVSAAAAAAYTTISIFPYLRQAWDGVEGYIEGGPRDPISTLEAEIEELKSRLESIDQFVKNHPPLLKFILEHFQRHPGVFVWRIHTPLPRDTSKLTRLKLKKSSIEFDLMTRYLYLEYYPELRAEFLKALRFALQSNKERA